MAWIKFTRDFPYAVTPKSVVDYKEGMHLNVKKEVADAAVKAGAGYETKHAPKAGDRNDGWQAERPKGNETPADGSLSEELTGDGTGESLPELEE